MKHKGKAQKACFAMLLKALGLLVVAFVAILVIGLVVSGQGVLSAIWLKATAGVLAGVFFLFAVFTCYFFRDPDPRTPSGPGLVIAPGHGKVDIVCPHTEAQIMGGACQRVSIFLSVVDVHVQNAPVSGRVTICKHTVGQYLNAMRADSAEFNENVLIGIEAADPRGEKIGLRLIAGLIARRIIPWLAPGEDIVRGERMSLIQFGSRVDVYLPLRAKVKVKPGDRVVGGETIIAAFE